MKSSFIIDEDGITITIGIDGKWEKAVGEMLEQYTICNVTMKYPDWSSHNTPPTAIVFRMEPKRD